VPLYIHGKEPDTDMITEEAYSPYFFKIKLDGKLTYEMKELGVVISYLVFSLVRNTDLKKTIVCFGGVLLFSIKEKRDLMHHWNPL
jgi:hypothetical protein